MHDSLYEQTNLQAEASFLLSWCKREGVEDYTAYAAQKRYTLEVTRVGVSEFAQKKKACDKHKIDGSYLA
jgi:hypothetical protein